MDWQTASSFQLYSHGTLGQKLLQGLVVKVNQRRRALGLAHGVLQAVLGVPRRFRQRAQIGERFSY